MTDQPTADPRFGLPNPEGTDSFPYGGEGHGPEALGHVHGGVPLIEHGEGVPRHPAPPETHLYPVDVSPELLGALMLSSLDRLGALVAQLVKVTEVSGSLLAATSHPHAGDRFPDTPVIGVERTVLPDRRAGQEWMLAGNVATAIVRAAPGRLGGQIVNSGANPCRLYLGSVEEVNGGAVNLPVLYLAGNGGAWDLRLSGVQWVGYVTAVSVLGTSLTVALV